MSTAFSMMMNFFRLVGNVFAASPEDIPLDVPMDVEIRDRGGRGGYIVAAEDYYDYPEDPPEVDYFEEHVYYLAPYRLFLSHLEGEGLGTNTGYSTLGGFFALGGFASSSSSQFEPFVDVRGHVLNDGRLAANVGAGTRYINYFQYIWGLNLYYDWRHGQHGHYQQAAGGLELLGKHWGLRANVYWPVGSKAHFSEPTIFSDYLGGFVVVCKEREQALKGVDAEVGFYSRIGSPGFNIYAGIGQYYYRRFCSKDILGGKARLILQGWDYLSLEGNYYYDRINHSIVTGKITLAFPFGNRPRSQIVRWTEGPFYEDVSQFKEIAYQPLLRNEMIYLEEMCQFEIFDGAGKRIRLSVIN